MPLGVSTVLIFLILNPAKKYSITVGVLSCILGACFLGNELKSFLACVLGLAIFSDLFWREIDPWITIVLFVLGIWLSPWIVLYGILLIYLANLFPNDLRLLIIGSALCFYFNGMWILFIFVLISAILQPYYKDNKIPFAPIALAPVILSML